MALEVQANARIPREWFCVTVEYRLDVILLILEVLEKVKKCPDPQVVPEVD